MNTALELHGPSISTPNIIRTIASPSFLFSPQSCLCVNLSTLYPRHTQAIPKSKQQLWTWLPLGKYLGRAWVCMHSFTQLINFFNLILVPIIMLLQKRYNLLLLLLITNKFHHLICTSIHIHRNNNPIHAINNL